MTEQSALEVVERYRKQIKRYPHGKPESGYWEAIDDITVDLLAALTAAPATTEPDKHEPQVRKFAGKEATCTVPGIEFVDGVCGLPEWKHTPSRMSTHKFQLTAALATLADQAEAYADSDEAKTIKARVLKHLQEPATEHEHTYDEIMSMRSTTEPVCENCGHARPHLTGRSQEQSACTIVGCWCPEFQPVASEADHADEQPAGSEPV